MLTLRSTQVWKQTDEQNDIQREKVTPVSHLARAFVALLLMLFYVHGKHLRSCRDGQLT